MTRTGVPPKPLSRRVDDLIAVAAQTDRPGTGKDGVASGAAPSS